MCFWPDRIGMHGTGCQAWRSCTGGIREQPVAAGRHARGKQCGAGKTCRRAHQGRRAVVNECSAGACASGPVGIGSGGVVMTVVVGCGAGFSGDRTDAAEPLVEALLSYDAPRALMFETLGEIGRAHV